MNHRQRLQTVLEGDIPNRMPHFELVLQLPEEAFGLSWPTRENMEKAAASESERLLDLYFKIWEKIIERYGWDAIAIDASLHGWFEDEVIPRARTRFGEEVMICSFNGQRTFWRPTRSRSAIVCGIA